MKFFALIILFFMVILSCDEDPARPENDKINILTYTDNDRKDRNIFSLNDSIIVEIQSSVSIVNAILDIEVSFKEEDNMKFIVTKDVNSKEIDDHHSIFSSFKAHLASNNINISAAIRYNNKTLKAEKIINITE